MIRMFYMENPSHIFKLRFYVSRLNFFSHTSHADCVLKVNYFSTNGYLFAHKFNTKNHKYYQSVTLVHEPYAVKDAWNPGIPPAPDPGPSDSIPWSNLFRNANVKKPMIIDVRTPSEFSEDHIPGAINIPVLMDNERAIVGSMYSKGDILQARLRGASFICTNLASVLENISNNYMSTSNLSIGDKELTRPNQYPDFIIYCWRGGQRSGSLATILSQVGWPGNIFILAGGYQSWRRLVLRQLDAWPRWSISGQFWVISGLTGSGKSLILEELSRINETVLNLEMLTSHKGSLFGADPKLGPNTQVRQKHFETKLHNLFISNQNYGCAPIVWIECESRAIGPNCRLSDSIWTKLRSTNPSVGTHRIWIDVNEDARIEWILENYAYFTKNLPVLTQIINELAKYHSTKKIKTWHEMVHRGDFAGFVRDIIRKHYDPLYRKSRQTMLKEAEENGLLYRVSLEKIDRLTIRQKLLPQLLNLAYSDNSKIKSTN